jgi:hypothetical protein
MDPQPRSVVPVLYVGRDMTPAAYELLRERRLGVLVAETPALAHRMLAHFSVVAIVFAVPDLAGLGALTKMGVPVVVLAARDAVCDVDGVTILRRTTDPEDLAAVVHGLVQRRLTREVTRDAA